jgi:hypothetical protein
MRTYEFYQSPIDRCRLRKKPARRNLTKGIQFERSSCTRDHIVHPSETIFADR